MTAEKQGGVQMENWKEQISQPKYGIKLEKDVFVPVRDGVRLAVDVYRPDADGKFPALLAMGGYGKDLQDLLIAPQPMKKSAVWDGNIEAGDTPEIVPRGYVHVIADSRGTGISEGEYNGMWSKQEAEDGHDLVEWLAQQPWCDGNVGMIGYSYYGKIQLKVAIEQPPHLKAIFVSHVLSDLYREMVYIGGVLSLFLYGLWDGRQGTSGFAPKNAVSQMVKTLPKEEFERRRQELINHPDIKHFPNLYHLMKYPYKNPQFFDMLMNPLDGPFWQERSIYPFFDKIKIPVHVVGKTPFTATGYWSVYFGLNTVKKLLVKPGDPEERPWREDTELIIRWYDHWLKGNDTGMLDEPPMKIFVPGINRWRFEKEWPPPETEWTECYLRRWEGLSFAPELHQPEPDYFLHLPLHLSNKRDSVQYLSRPLHEDVEMIGPGALKLFAAIDQDDTNWIAHLFDVAPTGLETRVARGFLKASHRAIDPDKSKPYAPYHPHTSAEPVAPGEINEYHVSLGNIVNVFKAGHRIKLMIDSRESPRDPEMQIHFHPHLCSSKPTLHKIYRNKEYQSRLILPILSKNKAVTEMLADDNLLM
jgi:predicted acyl esterase